MTIATPTRALARRRQLAARTKGELIDAILVTEGLLCPKCQRQPEDGPICLADGSTHSWL